MTCADARPLLPAHVYGDLSDADAAAVARHLRGCPACRGEAAALDQVRLALDAPATPPVRVNVPALFHEVADRRARRWRRLAVAGAALAAGLLLVLGLRMQIAVEADRVVISWGRAPAEPEALATVKQNPSLTLPARPEPDFGARLELQEELLRAVVADADARDRRYESEINAVRDRQASFARAVFDRFAEMERMASALYVAQFKRPEEKPNP
jgi:hypothetical protein